MDDIQLNHIKQLREELQLVQWKCTEGTDTIYYSGLRRVVSQLDKVIKSMEEDTCLS